MRILLLSLLTLVTATFGSAEINDTDPVNCFPYGTAKLSCALRVPDVPLNQWWCPASMAYGFQGFSYPLENPNCSAWENGYEAMYRDFKQMKRDFGATIIRMYYPVCTSSSVFEHALKAAATNNMAIIFQVWTNFGNGEVWRESQQATYDVLANPEYKTIAPYIVHSIEFGSEPVGDGMGGEHFVDDLANFRAMVRSTNVPVGISEDWDRPGSMSSQDGLCLGPVGRGVKANSDVAHIHPMPFYHDYNGLVDDAWGYIKSQTEWALRNVQLPTMISETQWAWGETPHNPGKADIGIEQFGRFWKTIDAHCEYFKSVQVGWFFHAWHGEGTFDIVKPDGDGYMIPDWRPQKC